ncbi:hypothetical protein Taro_018072 [Colocasia esculenta]|uniref:C2 domain-containing protein n=1 Tax=Colocasia esculenta TaxID=4460 RepID=A0A843UQH1_COLES|nr:hypothetical protein [Colocasia esculenta]
MEHAAIELKAICCQDLFLPIALFGKPPMYAVVSLFDGTGRAGRLQSQSTLFDRKGGRNPEWDQQLRFDLPVDKDSLYSIVLEFEFVSRRGVAGVLGDPVVGKARVFLRDLLEEYNTAFGGSGGRFRSVGFQVQSPDGKPGGAVTFLYRIRSQREGMESPAPLPASPAKPPASYYPPPPVSFPEESCAIQQPGAMYYYCCPAPAPPPPSDASGYPATDFNFTWSGSVQSWPPPPPPHAAVSPLPADPYGYAWKGYPWTGDAWGVDGRAHPPPMYGTLAR